MDYWIKQDECLFFSFMAMLLAKEGLKFTKQFNIGY